MVHKRPPIAGDSPAATASERLRVANINRRIAEELGVREQQVEATVALLDGGATVPFVARYRKEATGALDDTQLRTLEERLSYLRELDERRAAILDSIGQQGKLDAALKHAINAADSKARLEDLYLPYRPKRRTKAQIAREAGLEPLAEALLARPDQSPEQVARRYVDPSKGVVDSATALEGARAILVERFAEDATLIGTLREEVWARGRLSSRVRAGKAEPGAKFADYFEFSEPLVKLPSHRILALFRGEKAEVLTLELVADPVAPDRGEPGTFERQIANRFKIADHGRPGDRWLIDTVRLAWRTRMLVDIESDLRLRLWQAAEDAARLQVRSWMGLYARYLLPRLTHLSMGQKQLLPYRQRVVTGAAGRVLEIGIGSGLDLPLYGDAVEEIIGIDISPELLAMEVRAVAMV